MTKVIPFPAVRCPDCGAAWPGAVRGERCPGCLLSVDELVAAGDLLRRLGAPC